MYLFFGEEQQKQGVILDFNYDNILIASKSDLQWGIKCPDEKNNC